MPANAQAIDHALLCLAARKGQLDAEIAAQLLVAMRAKVDRALGFGSFAEYVERRLGYDARTTREKLRVARALETLPETRGQLTNGARTWAAVRELTRVATPETEGEWLARTERLTVRQVEALVRGRAPGDLPGDAPDPLITPRRMAFELPPEDFALVREAFEEMRREIGPSATDAAALRAMAEQVLGGRPARAAGYRTTLTVCAGCERTWQQAGGELVEVPPALAACARCDGEIAGLAIVEEVDADAGGARGSVPQQDPRAAPADVEISPRAPRPTGAAEAEDALLAAAMRVVETGGSRGLIRAASRLVGGSLRSITPRLRTAVRARDRGRCVVPGCGNFRFVDVHHLHPRARGGKHGLENLVSLCTRHHHAIHDGVLAIEGSPATGLRVRHAGGVLYGAPRAAREPTTPRSPGASVRRGLTRAAAR